MQTRAETATVGKKVAGMDGAQWAVYVREHPGCTLPPGAATLLVESLTEMAAFYQDALAKATWQWARERVTRNVNAGPFEKSFSDIINVVNVMRHAHGLPMFTDERELLG